jgi:hypothetical protein
VGVDVRLDVRAIAALVGIEIYKFIELPLKGKTTARISVEYTQVVGCRSTSP